MNNYTFSKNVLGAFDYASDLQRIYLDLCITIPFSISANYRLICVSKIGFVNQLILLTVPTLTSIKKKLGYAPF